ncbi:small ribosomal subunit protein bS16m [Canis lupus baileyi]|uniref:Small ribosomal subunit protein bS16m n=2 Tax=Canidae TaxID=9608 RepID=A0A8P0PHL1_CANLF|nr:28S ribosomal protein S16, mitochondrial [Canis lupus familiaris]|eukprot:XP_852347.3 28S ribosomal protein S16, mitochondrial [Canis lupus familiaris]
MGNIGAGERKGRGKWVLRFPLRGSRLGVSRCGRLRVGPPPRPTGGSALGGAARGARESAPAGCTMVQLTPVLRKAYHGGHLTIRLALSGCTNRPFYRIVAAHNKCPRDGRFVEQLGSYDPLPNSHGEKIVALNLERIRHWIGCGAHLSKPVERLLGLSGFFPLHPMMITNAERLRRKRAREVLLASQKTDTEATETKTS